MNCAADGVTVDSSRLCVHRLVCLRVKCCIDGLGWNKHGATSAAGAERMESSVDAPVESDVVLLLCLSDNVGSRVAVPAQASRCAKRSRTGRSITS